MVAQHLGDLDERDPAATISQATVWRSRCEPTSVIPARRQARRTVEATVVDAIGP